MDAKLGSKRLQEGLAAEAFLLEACPLQSSWRPKYFGDNCQCVDVSAFYSPRDPCSTVEYLTIFIIKFPTTTFDVCILCLFTSEAHKSILGFRKNFNATIYANSLIGVGVASSLYHISRGEIRKYLRWADYTMIATTTVCLSRALRHENPKLLMTASVLFLPLQPLMVSAVHTGLMEVAFAKRALTKPEMRMAHNLHTLSSLLGGALFIAVDVFPETPYLHAAWHLAAAIGVGTCNKLLG